MQDKVKDLKKKYYIKGSDEKYQIQLKEMYEKSKKKDIKREKYDKLKEKLKKHYKEKKREKKAQEKDEKVKEEKKQKSVENQDEDLTARGQKKGNVTILLFYAYVKPVWTNEEQDHAINFTYESLSRHGCTGRLRVAREGFNSVLTGTAEGIRAFTSDLKAYQPHNFANTDFKYVDR